MIPRKVDLIISPFHDWRKCQAEGFRTRDGHLLQHFAKHSSVGKMLVIDRPITFPEVLYKRRKLRSHGNIITRRGMSSISQVAGNIFVLNVFVLEILRPVIMGFKWWHYILCQPWISKEVEWAIDYLDIKKDILLMWTPVSAGIAKHIDTHLKVFDILDNWLHHPEMKAGLKEIKNDYRYLLDNADIVFANSSMSRKYFSTERNNIIYLENGVDPQRFQANDKILLSQIKNNIFPRPWIGYVGKLSKRVNVNLLLEIAYALEDATILILGPILDRAWIRPLLGVKNIVLLGDIHYDELPVYVGNFDVAIIPHNIGELEDYMNPIKLYEYMAAGRPIVATPSESVKKFNSIIEISSTTEGFVAAIQKYLKMTENEKQNLARSLQMAISPNMTWEGIANTMMKTIIDSWHK